MHFATLHPITFPASFLSLGSASEHHNSQHHAVAACNAEQQAAAALRVSSWPRCKLYLVACVTCAF